MTEVIESFAAGTLHSGPGPYYGRPFDRAFVESMVQGIAVTEYTDGALLNRISRVWDHFLKVAVV